MNGRILFVALIPMAPTRPTRSTRRGSANWRSRLGGSSQVGTRTFSDRSEACGPAKNLA
jgi:hypothetical protein